jgi:hypothetical protein
VPLPSLWPARTVVGRGLVMNAVEREHPLYLNKPWTRQKVRKILQGLALRGVYRASFRTVEHGLSACKSRIRYRPRTPSQTNSTRQPISERVQAAVTAAVSRPGLKSPAEGGR